VTRPGRLLANAKGTGAAVRELDAGMMLYPTGEKDGSMFEVEDELGNKGWVSSSMVELASKPRSGDGRKAAVRGPCRFAGWARRLPCQAWLAPIIRAWTSNPTTQNTASSSPARSS
jgi:hypothetical protein